MKRCLIADDNALVRDALAGSILQGWPKAQITLARDFPQAWSAVASGFDLCLADLDMPGATPTDGIGRLRALAPPMPILVITGLDHDAMMMQMLALGVAGFLPKSSNMAVIKAAIALVLAGGTYLPPRLFDLALSQQVLPSKSPAAKSPTSPDVVAPGLSQRQMDVARLAAKGLTNKEIGRELGVAPSTVKTHIEHAMQALNAQNRAGLAGAILGLPRRPPLAGMS